MDNAPGPSPDPATFVSSFRTTVPGPETIPPPKPPPPRPPGGHLGKIFFLAGALVVLVLAAGVFWLVSRGGQTGFEQVVVKPPSLVVTPPGPGKTATAGVEASLAAQPKVFRHKVCLGNACSAVDCSPPSVPCANSCNANSDCSSSVSLLSGPGLATPPASPKFHQECRNNTCVKVAGVGKNTCTSDVSCQPAAALPPVPQSGNPALTVAGLVLGVGALVLGLLLVF